jgi:glycine/D-amino acid oxidase-like deaminating enzyme
LLIATGHHRNGILLAPVTAMAIEELVTSGTNTGLAQPFGLDRFQMRQLSHLRSVGAPR